MGLSDGERFRGVFACVSEMHAIPRFTDYRFTHLNRYPQKLWPALLADQGNSSHWIFGGELDSDTMRESGLVCAAFHQVLGEFKEKDSEGWEPSGNEVLDFMAKYRPEMRNFLRDEEQKVLQLFRLSETFMYYANRYRDKLSANIRKIRSIVATLRGECYRIFSTEPNFLGAYLAGHIMDAVLTYKEDDMVNRWFMTQNIHHDVRLPDIHSPDDRQWLFSTFQKVRAAKQVLSSQQRLDIIFRFLGDRYHYKHEHDKLMAMVREHNKKRKDRISPKRVLAFCKASAKAHADGEQQDRNRPYYCALTESHVEPQRRPKPKTKRPKREKANVGRQRVRATKGR